MYKVTIIDLDNNVELEVETSCIMGAFKSSFKEICKYTYRRWEKIANKKNKLGKNIGFKKETFPHFRYYLKSGHPALIVSEHSDSEYKYRKVMHSERDGRHLNEVVNPNPNKRDKNPMYIAKRVRHDKKKHFGKKYPWKYHGK